MSARDELRGYVRLLADMWTPPSTTDERVERLYQTVRAEVLAEEKTTPGEHAGTEVTPEPPYTDSETAFMQVGTAHWPRRAVLHIDGLPPLVGTYNGAGMQRLEHHDGLLVELMLTFADRPTTTGEDSH